ncbi:hypothetical protein QO259_10120 [Salinicola sp. JS01]|uniref:hypothetical protein n=1 Tax=Salinicola sp. JS01 TaxID=3050071 RepID=UPI00255B5A7E|nr:hypothetical protein [Salinicola sp. JS01]WIX31195.1 hypothetical protein QO259_10120 [Salinicola sp. JS01]
MPFTLVKPTPMDWSGKRIVAGDQVPFITKFEATQDMIAAFVDECRQMVDSIQQGYDQMIEQMNATQAAAEQAAEDVEQTGLDRQATAADREQTGLNAQATAADRQQTGEDRAAVAADRQQTGEDRAATAADRQQTGEDVTATQQARQAAEDLYGDLQAVSDARTAAEGAATSAAEDADRAETAAGQAEGAVADHEAKADPHPQYVKDSTLQASYYTKAEVDSMVANAGPSTQVGAVGTYAFLLYRYSTLFEPGDTAAGSNLYYTNATNQDDPAYFRGPVSGTWRCMGHSWASSGNSRKTLWLRIA